MKWYENKLNKFKNIKNEENYRDIITWKKPKEAGY